MNTHHFRKEGPPGPRQPENQVAEGCTSAERTKVALRLFGDKPQLEVAEHHPEDALRVYIAKNFKPYNDESPEFPERLRIFTKNCENIRQRNAEKAKKGGKPITKLNLAVDEFIFREQGMKEMDWDWKPPGTCEIRYPGGEIVYPKSLMASDTKTVSTASSSDSPKAPEANEVGITLSLTNILEGNATSEAETRPSSNDSFIGHKASEKETAPPPHSKAGSTFAEHLARSQELVGDERLEEAAVRFSDDAFRVWMNRVGRTYSDEGQEFQDKLKAFLINAEITRKRNGQLCKERSKYSATLNDRADMLPYDECLSSNLAEPTDGGTKQIEGLKAKGSTVAERTKRALKLAGKRPLEDVAKDNPEDALRAYIKQNNKPYNDESPDFAEKLRIFTKTCQYVRRRNAESIAEGIEPHHGVNLMADTIEPGTWNGSEPMDAWIEPGGWLYETRGIKAVTTPASSTDSPEAKTEPSPKDSPEGVAVGEIDTRLSSKEVAIAGEIMMASAQEMPRSHAINEADTPPCTVESEGSTREERTQRALHLVGDRRLEDVAKDNPEDALRAYIAENDKPYNDESPEFPEKLRIFKATCDYVRRRNAEKIAAGRKATLGVNLMADEKTPSEWKGTEPIAWYWKPGGPFYDPASAPEGLTVADSEMRSMPCYDTSPKGNVMDETEMMPSSSEERPK